MWRVDNDVKREKIKKIRWKIRKWTFALELMSAWNVALFGFCHAFHAVNSNADQTGHVNNNRYEVRTKHEIRAQINNKNAHFQLIQQFSVRPRLSFRLKSVLHDYEFMLNLYRTYKNDSYKTATHTYTDRNNRIHIQTMQTRTCMYTKTERVFNQFMSATEVITVMHKT